MLLITLIKEILHTASIAVIFIRRCFYNFAPFHTIAFLFVGILFLMPASAFAQKIGVGVTSGMNASTHINNFRYAVEDIELDFKPRFKVGFNLGIMYRYIFSDHLRMQTEPSIIQLGAEYDDTFTLRGFEFRSSSKTNLTYIQIPILVQLTTVPPDRAEFPRPWAETTYHVTGGIYGGYLLEATFSGTNRGEPIGIQFEGEFSNDVSGQYSKFDGGVIIGGGFEYGLHTKFGMEVRGMMGILNTGDSQELDFDPKNMAITLALYYMF